MKTESLMKLLLIAFIYAIIVIGMILVFVVCQNFESLLRQVLDIATANAFPLILGGIACCAVCYIFVVKKR